MQPAPEIEQDEEDFSDHRVGALQLHLNDDSCVFLVRCFMLSVNVTLSCRLQARSLAPALCRLWLCRTQGVTETGIGTAVVNDYSS